ncbi:hypothetical protein Agabi119p4_2920 [Agaricus bisporus var. burnettii]|uniref:18S rRNA biogenesis protein RCL1 n=1 Tax=Agaricus bisporus var. burnettii TaxID=192524 RepID=A0A8H7F6G4_AGABI|nr:hypothetical protein Agabi119p4_2920 [Agaricus bisporus var. burnettii]
MSSSLLAFSGHQHLRHHLVLSLLSGKHVKIDKIRPDDKNPGLRDYEISLLRLLERVTNGTVIEISVTGTALLLRPGVISGGPVVHECPLSRSVGYFLEPIIMIAPFSKKTLNLTLKGITTDENDLSVDLLRTVTLPHLQLFGLSDGLELRIKKRGATPAGGGEVQFLCPTVKQVKTLNFVDQGKIKRIRGVSHAVRVNPQFSNRMIEAARSLLNRYIPDIYLYSDVYKGDESGKSPGYALSLLAESTTGAIHCAEAISQPGVAPEDIGLKATRALLSEINRGGEDVGRCVMGEPTAKTVQFLRDVRSFFGTSFKVVPADPNDSESAQLSYSCYGTGYVNANRTLA